ncbi:fumarylacetoacetate hydrolase family protein [Sneathiella aquimaris]|uniref:fumarylacetoacetate hydrolase family protein n=1 Tax=Sneathiella aquimaris TaxID=2599305 RepID=UPI001469CF67|nr:fumarylacetoacetate hydrolase family protein [Sneathiella aquimaris]
MKFASLKNETRDGQLVVVSRDLTECLAVTDIAPTLQYALDHWEDVKGALEEAYIRLNKGTAEKRTVFDQQQALSPLPRAYQWADGSAYVNHVELVRKARGAEMPPSFWTDPLMYQGGSDTFLAPTEDIPLVEDAWGLDFEGELAIVTDDVPMGIQKKEASDKIRLVMMVNDISLRGLIPPELGKGFGFFHSKPSSAFAPVAVTPDELGSDWKDGKLHRPLEVTYNGTLFGCPDAGTDMTFDFLDLIQHAAKSRKLGAGAIIGSGTVSNKLDGGPGKTVAEGGRGFTCLAEIRMIETIENGQPSTPFMKTGDRVVMEMLDPSGHSIFGRIDQKVVKTS